MDRLPAVSPVARLLTGLLSAVALAGCGSLGASSAHAGRPEPQIPAQLEREARPIGPGPRFHPRARGPVPGRCEHRLGPRSAVHVEVFAADRVVVIAAAIGVRGPVRRDAGRIVVARCFGSLATLEPTGVVLLRPGSPLTLGALFRAWGEPLSPTRVASFVTPAGRPVRVYVHGRRVAGPPGTVPLRRHGEVVVEIGPYVPPHHGYTFPPGV